MRIVRWTSTLALAAVAAAPLGAQQMGAMHGAGHDHAMKGEGTMQMCPMMGGHAMEDGMEGMHPARAGAAALFGGVELSLTTEQKAKLDELVAQTREEHHAHMQAAMAVQGRAAEALAGANPDLGAYERSLQEAATHAVEAHMAFAKATLAARALLTAEQLAKLPKGSELVHTMMCGMMGEGMMGHAMMGPSR